MTTRNDLLEPSWLMSLILPQMTQLRAAYEGGSVFKSLVLKKKPTESQALFDDKIDNVAAQPICKSIIEELVNIIFSYEPTREVQFGNANRPVATPDWVEDFLDNADLENNTLSDVMEKAATLASMSGWSWIFMDLPSTPDTKNRPYLSVSAAENVIAFDYDTATGSKRLTSLKVIEYQDQEKTIIKVWTAGYLELDEETGTTIAYPTTAERYVIDNKDKAGTQYVAEETFEFSFDYPIPAIQLLPVPDINNKFIGVSDISEAADVQRQVLRLEAEAFDSIRFSKPLIRAVAGMQIPAGGGGIARGEKDSIEVFEIPTADISEIRLQQESILTMLDSYSGRGGTRKSSTSLQSGISIIEERRGLHRKAASRARVMQSTEEEVFNFVAAMMGITWSGSIEYNTDFEARDVQFRLALLKTAKELSPNNATVTSIVDDEVIRLIAPPDEVQAYLDEDASNGINTNTQEPNVVNIRN